MAWSTMVVASLWVMCLGLLCQCIGFAIPFWFGYETAASAATNDKTLQTYVGSWYVMSCIKGEASSCKTEAIEPKVEDTTSNVAVIGLALSASGTQDIAAKATAAVLSLSKYWIAVVITATCSLGLCFLAGLIFICCRCAGIHSQKMFAISTIILLIGACGVVGISAYAAYLVGDKFDFLQSVNAARFPWSILLFGIGGLAGIAAAFLMLVIICNWGRYGDYLPSDKDSLLDDDVQMSDINKSRRERGQDNPRYNDYPREPSSDAKRGYPDRNGYGGSPRKEYTDYISRDQPIDRYDRDRGRDRHDDRSHDRNYSKNRGYEREPARNYESYDRRAAPAYERERDYRDYHSSRKDNMYRPYQQSVRSADISSSEHLT